MTPFNKRNLFAFLFVAAVFAVSAFITVGRVLGRVFTNRQPGNARHKEEISAPRAMASAPALWEKMLVGASCPTTPWRWPPCPRRYFPDNPALQTLP